MRPDEFMARLQNVQDSKELVDLLVQATALEPPMLVSFPPAKGTKLACTKILPLFLLGLGLNQFRGAEERRIIQDRNTIVGITLTNTGRTTPAT